MLVALSRPISVLCCAVSGKRRQPYWTSYQRPFKILAQNLLTKRGKTHQPAKIVLNLRQLKCAYYLLILQYYNIPILLLEGHVPRRNRRNTWCNRTSPIRENSRTIISSDCQMCFKSTFPGTRNRINGIGLSNSKLTYIK